MFLIFGYVSALLSIFMILPYVRDILRGGTRPERASWLIWTVLGLVAFFSQLAKGATDSLWLTAGQTLAVFIVFLLSIKYGTGGLSKRDVRALIAAALGLVLWYVTSNAIYALIIVILIDAIGSALTLVKSYHEPESETMSTWVISGASGVFGALAVGSFNPVLLAYPLYIVVANYAITLLLLLGKKKLLSR